MKRILITLSALIAVSIGIFAYTQQDGRITGADLPKTAQDFLKNHFGDKGTVVFAEKDWNEYDVKLANGFEIEFFSDGTWKDIEANREAIPASILNTLPSKIATYINTNYKDWTLTDISKKKYGYEMELINPAMGSDVELKFNQAGELIKLDY